MTNPIPAGTKIVRIAYHPAVPEKVSAHKIGAVGWVIETKKLKDNSTGYLVEWETPPVFRSLLSRSEIEPKL